MSSMLHGLLVNRPGFETEVCLSRSLLDLPLYVDIKLHNLFVLFVVRHPQC